MKQRGKYVARVNGQVVRLGDTVPIRLGGLAFGFLLFGVSAAKPYNNSERQYDFSRAQDLLRRGKMQEAYDRFERLAADTTAEQGDRIGANAELALGRMEIQQADPDESLKHFVKARELDRRLEREAEENGRYVVREYALFALMGDACLFERNDEALALAEKAGQTNEAVERINEIIDADRQFGLEKLQAMALVTRAEIAGCVGDESMGAGLIKALDITRRLGLKPLEPQIYLLYGSWLLQRGDFDLAVQTWEQGFSQSEGVGLFHISFRFLLSLAEAQQETGTPEALRRAWVRIERYALEHPDLPPSALEDLEQARSRRRVDKPDDESQAEQVSVAEFPPGSSSAGAGEADDASLR